MHVNGRVFPNGQETVRVDPWSVRTIAGIITIVRSTETERDRQTFLNRPDTIVHAGRDNRGNGLARFRLYA